MIGVMEEGMEGGIRRRGRCDRGDGGGREMRGALRSYIIIYLVLHVVMVGVVSSHCDHVSIAHCTICGVCVHIYCQHMNTIL